MSRQKICAGNWKMYKNLDEAHEFFRALASALKPTTSRVVIFPPAYVLALCEEAASGLARADIVLEYGPQNIHFQNEGAFTGENSPLAARTLGCEFALIGHSERRTLFRETDEETAKKVKAAIDNHLVPMLCVGETLAEREAGKTAEVVERQLRAGLSAIDAAHDNYVIAYEPVWAIGTGKTATPAQAEETHASTRKTLQALAGEKKAQAVSILYGGSVKPDNAAGLASQSNIDGFLIGGASLKADDFARIAATL